MGTFDGVHRGHRALIAAASRHARALQLPLVAVTFSPRPQRVFDPAALPDICSLSNRIERLYSAGANTVLVLPFNRQVAQVDYKDFAALLVHYLQPRALFVGEDFALGRGRAGTPDRLRATGLSVYAHPALPSRDRSRKVSSSDIRELIASGMSAGQALAAV
jgi:riboflavin kinase/FMN adenylyltransferase